MYNKFKHILENDLIFYTLIIVLVAVASFGLGKQSQQASGPKNTSSDIVITQTQPKAIVAGENTQQTQLVGSKNGSKYHLLTCPGASQINEENKVFFASVEEARAKGYTPAGNCEGL